MTVGMMSEWGERASARRRRIARVWRDCIIGALVSGAALGAAVATEAPGPRWALMAVALVAIAYTLWVGSVHYFRVIDDHEREAALWSGTVGLYGYVFLYGAQIVAGDLGMPVQGAHRVIFWTVLGITLAAFLWKRYR